MTPEPPLPAAPPLYDRLARAVTYADIELARHQYYCEAWRDWAIASCMACRGLKAQVQAARRALMEATR